MFSVLTLCEQEGEEEVTHSLVVGGELELLCDFINVHESQASGNSFLPSVADKHVSGQCLCDVVLRRRCIHYKVLEWLLSFSFTFTYCCCLDPSTPQLCITTNLKILD